MIEVNYNEYKETIAENMKLIQENHKLKEEFYLMRTNASQLAKRIDKAIEYIENNDLYEQDEDYDYEENLVLGVPDDSEPRKILLEILKGSDKE